MEAVCGRPFALPCPWLAAFALFAFAAFWSALAAPWSAALLPVLLLVALCAFWSVAGAGVVAAAPLWAFWSLVALDDDAELEAGAVELWLLMSPEVAFEFELGAAVVELELAVPGAVAAFWSVVLDGAAVGFAWLEVWSVTPGVVEVWPLVALGAVLSAGAVDWLELAGAAVWFMSELLLEAGAVDDWLELLAGAVALGVWLFWLLGSVVVLDVWATAKPADSSNAEHV
jgi:hypothetical protein